MITPGHTSGESLHVLSALEHPNGSWHTDVEGTRASISAAISLLLRLVGRDPDAARSRDHALLSVLVERVSGASHAPCSPPGSSLAFTGARLPPASPRAVERHPYRAAASRRLAPRKFRPK